MAPWLSIHSAPSKRGKGGGASHQRGNAFPRPPGRLYGFRRQRRYKKWRRRRRTSPAQRYYITPEGEALNPSGRRQPVPDRTLGAQGQRPGGAINPHARKGVSTFGNTASRRFFTKAHGSPDAKGGISNSPLNHLVAIPGSSLPLSGSLPRNGGRISLRFLHLLW